MNSHSTCHTRPIIETRMMAIVPTKHALKILLIIVQLEISPLAYKLLHNTGKFMDHNDHNENMD